MKTKLNKNIPFKGLTRRSNIFIFNLKICEYINIDYLFY